MSDQHDAGEPYVLGHTRRELDRLDLQGALYRDVTRRALVAGGVAPGIRVLDLGSGSGDVAFLAAELVGPDGSVLGIEREAGTVEAARSRALRRAEVNVTFRVAAGSDLLEDGPFDALIGRFILMHQPDPSATLRGALRNIRSGGAVVFVESCMAAIAGYHSMPHSPLYDAVVRWK